MGNPTHVQAVNVGAKRIAKLRTQAPGLILDLKDEDFSRRNLSGLDLSDADLCGADLTECNCEGTIFDRAKLHSAKLRGANCSRASMLKTELNSAIMNESTLDYAILRDASLQNAELARATFARTDLTNADLTRSLLHEAKFSETIFSATVLTHCKLDCAEFSNSKLGPDTFNSAVLATCTTLKLKFSGVVMSGLDLCECNFPDALFSSVDLTNSKLNNARLNGARFQNVVLSGIDLRGVDFSKADLCDVDISNLNLTGVSFSNSRLDRASMLGSVVDSTTRFDHLKCYHLRVDRFTAEYMREHVQHGQMMDLKIVDDLAKLRSEFSGVWATIHLFGICVFLLPYLWFLVWRFAASESLAASESAFMQVEEWGKLQGVDETLRTSERFKKSLSARVAKRAKDWRTEFQLSQPNEISVLDALCRYIWNGGVRWREGYIFSPWSVVSFIVVAWYNVLRSFLLWKTKKLETEQAVTGLPVKFSLGSEWSRWRTVYKLNYFGYWISLALIVVHAMKFLTQTVRV